MKNLLFSLCFLVIVHSVDAETTLRMAYFFPQTESISLYVSQDGFQRTAVISVDALAQEQQVAVQGALNWLASQLPEGFTTINQVILEPAAPVPISFSEEGEPTAWERFLTAAVTGTGPKGQRSISIINAPSEIQTALLAIWDALENQ